MPKRPRAHQLEERSRQIFREILPDSWVMRDKFTDYGIDAEVEIFGADGVSTGKIFDVQLKSAEVLRTKQPSTRLKKETISYYQSMDRPVLIALVEISTHKIFRKWADEVDFYGSKESSKTIGVKYNDEDLWVAKTAEQLGKELNHYRILKGPDTSHPLDLTFGLSGDIPAEFPRHSLCARLTRKISRHADEIKIAPVWDENCVGSILLSPKEIRIAISRFGGGVLHGRPLSSADSDELESLADDIIALLALTLAHFRRFKVAANLFECICESSIFDRHHQYMAVAMDVFFEEGRNSLAMKLYERALGGHHPEVAMPAQIRMLRWQKQCSDEEIEQIIEINMKLAVEARKDGAESYAGSLCYNMGNLLRSRGAYRRAVWFYRQARIDSPDYRERSYYIRELGSLYYGTGHYSAACDLYKQAYLSSGKSLYQALHADALFFTGRLEDCRSEYQKYFESEQSPQWEFFARDAAAAIIIYNCELKSQNRQPSKVKNICLPSEPADSTEEAQKIVEARWKMDVLCAESWRFLADTYFNLGDTHSAALAYFVEANIRETSFGAWFNAISCAIPHEEIFQFAGLALASAVTYLGLGFVDQFLEFAEGKLEPDQIEDFLKILKSIQDTMPHSNTPDTVVRIPDGEAMIEMPLGRMPET